MVSFQPAFSTPSARWAALVERDPAAGSAFIYAVTTTKIYCRPTCSSRLARRANVVFYASPSDAKSAGFRACKRCKPDSESWDARAEQREMVERACKAIRETGAGSGSDAGCSSSLNGSEGSEAGLSLAELAKGAGRTKSHFHRVFRRVVGMTPRGYGQAIRKQRGLGEDVLDSESSSDSTGASTEVSTPAVSSDEWMCSTFDDMWDHSMSSSNGIVEYDFGLAKATTDANDDIEYTIQSWSSGFVLIAATSSGICFLDAGDSEEELLRSFRARFPYAEIRLSEWWWGISLMTEAEFPKIESGRHGMFEGVMEALVQPSGKMLDVTFEVPFGNQDVGGLCA